ncbi:phosphotransferase family protein [Streptomyces capillispiralis]|uniref:Fructosamine-3-kinase n=1 Tax=Streptomyces capillispiralis TaxID=68182 RepID=A0A561T8L7_9ACTN|nr:aminoglycoside phosphotransferase family protein [Streptomyces capillispiralis]TWF83462.1 fructosamine-3-kinase [Streptomyces capillispiralis]GHH91750.1 phosphotransferase [Streptomyces capillispiralis]
MGDSWERARRVLAGAGLSPGSLARVRPLGGGTYNTVEEILLTDGHRYVLKIPPAPATPGLRHERRLLVAEAEFCVRAAEARVPAPRAVSAGGDTALPYLLMTARPGSPWTQAAPAGEERTELRTELGRQVARLHRVTGPGFGYPSGALGPLAPDWRTAFTAMTDAVLADARHYGARLPRPVDEVAGVLATAAPALDEVTVPALVHFDLWPGNILVERPARGPARIGGLIDGERMLWGDPLADFVSLALLGDIREDEAFLAGYEEAGGRAVFDRAARLRLALYRAYLYLIMLTETVPRASGADHDRWLQEAVAPELGAALDEITALR